MTREPLPLATIHDAVLEFLRGRDDAVLYGAQAVNAYVKESRMTMTQDVDIASDRAEELAERAGRAICASSNSFRLCGWDFRLWRSTARADRWP
jgi:hypothetical protein